LPKGLTFDLREASGALGDLGTLLPLTLGAIAIGGLAPTPVFLGFAVFYIATALVYRLPVPVQPMKALAAILLAGLATPASIAAAGVLVGTVLLFLGASGLIDRLGRLVPQSVLKGLQLGLGIVLAFAAVKLMGTALVFGLFGTAGLAGLLVLGRIPASLVFLAAAGLMGQLLGLPALSVAVPTEHAWLPGLPSGEDFRTAVGTLAMPQLSLTLTNAVLLTALVAKDSYGARARAVTPRRLCLTSGAANLLLAPLGALPMCHGAGGVVAHSRFGARTGGAPLMLGVVLLGIAILPADQSIAMLSVIPTAALGVLLLFAALELGANRRLFDCRPSCRPVIATTAIATALVNPLIGLIAGTVAEVLRKAILRRRKGQRVT
jgi:MFS superfamily sulfate permease-like transporter